MDQNRFSKFHIILSNIEIYRSPHLTALTTENSLRSEPERKQTRPQSVDRHRQHQSSSPSFQNCSRNTCHVCLYGEWHIGFSAESRTKRTTVRHVFQRTGDIFISLRYHKSDKHWLCIYISDVLLLESYFLDDFVGSECHICNHTKRVFQIEIRYVKIFT